MKVDEESTPCPYCKSVDSCHWASERGWAMVKCQYCGFLYCNPRPSPALRKESTQLGTHTASNQLDIAERRISSKVNSYRQILGEIFSDVWAKNETVSWIDIGAGYGEVVESVKKLAPIGSKVFGLEPMQPKVNSANARSLQLICGFIDDNTPVCQYASVIDIFSHIYDFDAFLKQVRNILVDGGELFIETGDMGCVKERSQFPGELGLPDHVVFASEKHLKGFLKRNGFIILSVERVAIDTIYHSLKMLVKRIIGRDVRVNIPYTSPYRTMRVRAKKIDI